MGKIALSFVIPIYNVERYLRECIESIAVQVEKLEVNDLIEVILVNDGSTDSSGNICNDYARQKDYIKVIHEENKGLAMARNIGLEIATGRYIAFVDSDDRIDRHCLGKIIQWIENTDAEICFMKTVKFFPNGKVEKFGEKIERKDVINKTQEDVVKYISTRPKFPGSACCKLYSHKFLVDNNLFFPKDKRVSEDLGFAYACLTKAKKFDVLEFPYYEYRQQRAGSITNTFNAKSFWDLSLFVTESSRISVSDNKPNDLIHKYALSFVAYEYVQLVLGYIRLKGEDRKKAKTFLDEYMWVLEYAASKKIIIIKYIIHILGIPMTSFLLDLYVYRIR